ncbi:acyl-CoA dehydrogenase [Saccharopolyspora mangrovi]|uniref:Acyl-CoA dehydrogenase n=1 Tax=Saccharopolyspora mangrovi TaxID=3082379 RepID=A0ABU6AG83_9PSEU|nr:acyl-CoA dehydrogenase [Saccharopolyspora sp. S2-29]MEB3370583.1 acyl-CoA dehydrogenase [Saccharopolyspora sp. S2-29]MEB3371014.1 acyl-CoA dehydrogenase [Saccharopolyspora sp. S2-29]
MPIAITDEQRALQESIRSWAEGLGTDPVRKLESAEAPVWHEEETWTGLTEIGVFSLLAEGIGTLADLAAGLEQAADALVPGPVWSTALAVALLGDADFAEGRATAAAALEPGELNAVETADGLVVSGRIAAVPGAMGVTHLLLPARSGDREVWFLVAADQAERHPRASLDLSRPVAEVVLRDVAIPAENVLDRDVRDLAVTLAAAEAAGIASWCLRTAVEHAGTREQFGQVIGSFQAVKHFCARMLCEVEKATALAWDAARAAEDAPDEHPLAAAAAGAAVFDAAVEVAKDCIQVLGGIGFTWEHDAHLYLRRALALRQTVGGSAGWRRRVADLSASGARRRLSLSAELPEDRRGEIRSAVEGIAALSPQQQRIRLAETGYLAPHWPRPYGCGASPHEQLLIDEELDRAGVRRPDMVVGNWAVPTIVEHGTDAQRERFVWPTLRGEVTWCQLFSEPGAGSDLAGLRTKAERVDGGWKLTGQKVWTSLAQEADWGICLARTDPEAPKHRGISYFLVDMRSEGITVRPLREITGVERFNEVFLDEVFVPDDCLVAEPGQGWKLARTTLANERVALGGGSSLGQEVERLLADPGCADPSMRERLGAAVVDGLTGSLLRLRSTLRSLHGRGPGAESSVEKLLGVWHRQNVAELGTEVLGAEALVVEAEPVHEVLLTRALSIAGGTTQILLNVIAERILGLPR